MKVMDPLPEKKVHMYLLFCVLFQGILVPLKWSTNTYDVWQISSTPTGLLVREAFAKGNPTSLSRSPYNSWRPRDDSLNLDWANTQ